MRLLSPALSAHFHGTIDEVRISNIARYTEDFTPQRRFEPDEHTMALYHFDEGSGDVLKDSSGNGHDGKIVGAKWVKVDEGSGGVADDPDRRAAEWVLGIGGSVTVITDGKEVPSIETPGELPEGTFLVTDVDLNGRSEATNAGFGKLIDLSGLRTLNLNRTDICDLDLPILSTLNRLAKLELANNRRVTDFGLKTIGRMRELRILGLGATGITDTCLEHVAALKKLTYLNLSNTEVTDVGLQRLAAMPNLVVLNLGGEQLTQASTRNPETNAKAANACDLRAS